MISFKKNTLLQKAVTGLMLITFLSTSLGPLPMALAQNIPNLPVPGTVVSLSSAFTPAVLKGMTIHPDNPFLFDFIVHPGDDALEGSDLEAESMKMIKYFLAALTVPEDEMWVNLSPFEKNRIIPEGFGDTEMGRDLLAQDYLLKQLTASLMSPDNELGSQFWERVRQLAYKKYGTTDVPMDTFNKVWIVPEKATVFESGRSVFVVDSHLKVMLEEDYLALEHHTAETASEEKEMAVKVVREVILPEIEREVNEGASFAQLRQISNAVILATWYKENIKQSILNREYIDQNKTEGIDLEDKEINQKIYEQYLEAFEKGVANFIREEYDLETKEMIPRKYFTGGAIEDWRGKIEVGDQAMLDGGLQGTVRVRTQLSDINEASISQQGLKGILRADRELKFYPEELNLEFIGANFQEAREEKGIEYPNHLAKAIGIKGETVTRIEEAIGQDIKFETFFKMVQHLDKSAYQIITGKRNSRYESGQYDDYDQLVTNLGRNLFILRTEFFDMTAEQLGKLMGLSKTTVNKIQNLNGRETSGKVHILPQMRDFVRMSLRLNVPMDILIGNEETLREYIKISNRFRLYQTVHSFLNEVNNGRIELITHNMIREEAKVSSDVYTDARKKDRALDQLINQFRGHTFAILRSISFLDQEVEKGRVGVVTNEMIAEKAGVNIKVVESVKGKSEIVKESISLLKQKTKRKVMHTERTPIYQAMQYYQDRMAEGDIGVIEIGDLMEKASLSKEVFNRIRSEFDDIDKFINKHIGAKPAILRAIKFFRRQLEEGVLTEDLTVSDISEKANVHKRTLEENRKDPEINEAFEDLKSRTRKLRSTSVDIIANKIKEYQEKFPDVGVVTPVDFFISLGISESTFRKYRQHPRVVDGLDELFSLERAILRTFTYFENEILEERLSDQITDKMIYIKAGLSRSVFIDLKKKDPVKTAYNKFKVVAERTTTEGRILNEIVKHQDTIGVVTSQQFAKSLSLTKDRLNKYRKNPAIATGLDGIFGVPNAVLRALFFLKQEALEGRLKEPLTNQFIAKMIGASVSRVSQVKEKENVKPIFEETKQLVDYLATAPERARKLLQAIEFYKEEYSEGRVRGIVSVIMIESKAGISAEEDHFLREEGWENPVKDAYASLQNFWGNKNYEELIADQINFYREDFKKGNVGLITSTSFAESLGLTRAGVNEYKNNPVIVSGLEEILGQQKAILRAIDFYKQEILAGRFTDQMSAGLLSEKASVGTATINREKSKDPVKAAYEELLALIEPIVNASHVKTKMMRAVDYFQNEINQGRIKVITSKMLWEKAGISDGLYYKIKKDDKELGQFINQIVGTIPAILRAAAFLNKEVEEGRIDEVSDEMIAEKAGITSRTVTQNKDNPTVERVIDLLKVKAKKKVTHRKHKPVFQAMQHYRDRLAGGDIRAISLTDFKKKARLTYDQFNTMRENSEDMNRFIDKHIGVKAAILRGVDFYLKEIEDGRMTSLKQKEFITKIGVSERHLLKLKKVDKEIQKVLKQILFTPFEGLLKREDEIRAFYEKTKGKATWGQYADQFDTNGRMMIRVFDALELEKKTTYAALLELIEKKDEIRRLHQEGYTFRQAAPILGWGPMRTKRSYYFLGLKIQSKPASKIDGVDLELYIYFHPEETIAEIAKHFGVTPATISRAIFVVYKLKNYVPKTGLHARRLEATSFNMRHHELEETSMEQQELNQFLNEIRKGDSDLVEEVAFTYLWVVQKVVKELAPPSQYDSQDRYGQLMSDGFAALVLNIIMEYAALEESERPLIEEYISEKIKEALKKTKTDSYEKGHTGDKTTSVSKFNESPKGESVESQIPDEIGLTPDEVLEGIEAQEGRYDAEILKPIAEFPESSREILNQHVKGIPLAQIADQMGIPRQEVVDEYQRIVQFLREQGEKEVKEYEQAVEDEKAARKEARSTKPVRPFAEEQYSQDGDPENSKVIWDYTQEIAILTKPYEDFKRHLDLGAAEYKLEAAEELMQKAEDRFEMLGGKHNFQSTIRRLNKSHNRLANAFIVTGNLRKAEIHLQAHFERFERNKDIDDLKEDPLYIIGTHAKLAHAYYVDGNYKKAKETLSKTIKQLDQFIFDYPIVESNPQYILSRINGWMIHSNDQRAQELMHMGKEFIDKYESIILQYEGQEEHYTLSNFQENVEALEERLNGDNEEDTTEGLSKQNNSMSEVFTELEKEEIYQKLRQELEDPNTNVLALEYLLTDVERIQTRIFREGGVDSTNGEELNILEEAVSMLEVLKKASDFAMVAEPMRMPMIDENLRGIWKKTQDEAVEVFEEMRQFEAQHHDEMVNDFYGKMKKAKKKWVKKLFHHFSYVPDRLGNANEQKTLIGYYLRSFIGEPQSTWEETILSFVKHLETEEVYESYPFKDNNLGELNINYMSVAAEKVSALVQKELDRGIYFRNLAKDGIKISHETLTKIMKGEENLKHGELRVFLKIANYFEIHLTELLTGVKVDIPFEPYDIAYLYEQKGLEKNLNNARSAATEFSFPEGQVDKFRIYLDEDRSIKPPIKEFFTLGSILESHPENLLRKTIFLDKLLPDVSAVDAWQYLPEELTKEKMKEIGKRFKDLRLFLGQTREEVAEAVEISPNTLFEIENGSHEDYKSDTFLSLTNYYGVDPFYIFLERTIDGVMHRHIDVDQIREEFPHNLYQLRMQEFPRIEEATQDITISREDWGRYERGDSGRFPRIKKLVTMARRIKAPLHILLGPRENIREFSSQKQKSRFEKLIKKRVYAFEEHRHLNDKIVWRKDAAQRLKDLMEIFRFNQGSLARNLRMDEDVISGLLNPGLRDRIELETVRKLADLFGVSFLFFNKGYESEDSHVNYGTINKNYILRNEGLIRKLFNVSREYLNKRADINLDFSVSESTEEELSFSSFIKLVKATRVPSRILLASEKEFTDYWADPIKEMAFNGNSYLQPVEASAFGELLDQLLDVEEKEFIVHREYANGIQSLKHKIHELNGYFETVMRFLDQINSDYQKIENGEVLAFSDALDILNQLYVNGKGYLSTKEYEYLYYLHEGGKLSSYLRVAGMTIGEFRNMGKAIAEKQFRISQLDQILDQFTLKPNGSPTTTFVIQAPQKTVEDLEKDAAMAAPGGIDMNPQNMDMEKSGASEMIFFAPDNFENVTIQGLVPVILEIAPITNIPLLLGEVEQESPEQLSYIP